MTVRNNEESRRMCVCVCCSVPRSGQFKIIMVCLCMPELNIGTANRGSIMMWHGARVDWMMHTSDHPSRGCAQQGFQDCSLFCAHSTFFAIKGPLKQRPILLEKSSTSRNSTKEATYPLSNNRKLAEGFGKSHLEKPFCPLPRWKLRITTRKG